MSLGNVDTTAFHKPMNPDGDQLSPIAARGRRLCSERRRLALQRFFWASHAFLRCVSSRIPTALSRSNGQTFVLWKTSGTVGSAGGNADSSQRLFVWTPPALSLKNGWVHDPA